jgi:hypothetical protein
MEIWEQTDELRIAAAQVRWAAEARTHRSGLFDARSCRPCECGARNDVMRPSVACTCQKDGSARAA